MRNYISEVLNGADLAATFAELSNKIRSLYSKERNDNEEEQLCELSDQDRQLRSFMAYQYMKEHDYYLDDESPISYWKNTH